MECRSCHYRQPIPLRGGGDTQSGVKPVFIKENGFDIAGPAWSFTPPEREFYVGAGLDEWDHERGDSPVLKDMAELDQAINLRVGGAWKLFVGTVFADFAQDVATHEGAQVKLRYPPSPRHAVQLGNALFVQSGGLFGNLVNSVTSGEGVVLRFSERGKVHICSRNPARLLPWCASTCLLESVMGFIA